MDQCRVDSRLIHLFQQLIVGKLWNAAVVIRHRTVVSSHGPWVSQAVDTTVVGPALERVKATARLTPSASVGGAPVRTMRDGSQSFGPYLDPDRDPVIDDA